MRYDECPQALELPNGDLWVFGYGSLMWNPGFAYSEKHTARLYGHHRALCVWSWVHRGSQNAPGLVLGLDRGGSCLGRAYRIAAKDKVAVADYLYRREMVTPVYLPVLRRLRLAAAANPKPVLALTFVADRRHPQYAGRLSVAAAHATVSRAVGRSGANPDYVTAATEHIRELGIRDLWLEELTVRLRSRDFKQNR